MWKSLNIILIYSEVFIECHLLESKAYYHTFSQLLLNQMTAGPDSVKKHEIQHVHCKV